MNTLEAKREALAKERIENKYKSHKDCTFIEVIIADKLQEFYNFISTHIRYTEEDYQRYNDRYCIGEKYDKYSIRNWIIEKIAKQTKPSDIIILPFLDFGICVELLRVEAFFESELDEKISQHIGLDISIYHSKYYIISLMKSILFSNIMKDYKICPLQKKHLVTI